MDTAAIIEEFRSETTDHLAELDAQLLKLEREPGEGERVRRMFLAAHSIKGGAAMLELDEIRDLAHAMEDVLGHLRDGKAPLTRDTADLLFRAVDTLRELVRGELQPRERRTANTEELITRLRTHLVEAVDQRPAPVSAQRPAGGASALLAENSPTLQRLETMILGDAGYAVDVVEDGNEALAAALAGAYRLVVTGMELKGLRGLDLAAGLHQEPRTRGIAVVVFTNEQVEEDQRKARIIEAHYLRRDKAGYQRLQELAEMIQQRAAS